MAKPYPDQTGCGLHLHISLQDKTGRNVFDGGAAPASAVLEHAVGGILDIMPESMAMLAPNVNSFRRYQPNVFVPIRRTWGFENRSTALRIPLGRAAARPLEHRVPGPRPTPRAPAAPPPRPRSRPRRPPPCPRPGWPPSPAPPVRSNQSNHPK